MGMSYEKLEIKTSLIHLVTQDSIEWISIAIQKCRQIRPIQLETTIHLLGIMRNSTRSSTESLGIQHWIKFSVRFLTLIVILISAQLQILAKQLLSGIVAKGSEDLLTGMEGLFHHLFPTHCLCFSH